MKYELNTRLLNNWKTRECIVNSNCIWYNKRYTQHKKVSRRYFDTIIIKTRNAFLYEDNGCFRVSFVYRSYTRVLPLFIRQTIVHLITDTVCTNNCVVNERRILRELRKISKNKVTKKFLRSTLFIIYSSKILLLKNRMVIKNSYWTKRGNLSHKYGVK